jgi:hypothetical protein
VVTTDQRGFAVYRIAGRKRFRIVPGRVSGHLGARAPPSPHGGAAHIRPMPRAPRLSSTATPSPAPACA